jgi:hypothetical protein
VVTAQHSLVEDGSCGVVSGVGGNLTGDPALSPGLTPSAGSIVFDAGLDSLVPPGATTDLAGNPRIQGARVDMGAYELTVAAPTPTSTPTATATATATPLPTPGLAPNQIVLPLVSVHLAQPDLVVEQIGLDPAKTAYRAGELVQISVRVRNIGSAPAGGFWVDLYINPAAPPDAANQPWGERCGLVPCYGMAWQVAGLGPGDSVLLSAAQIDPAQSRWAGRLAPGTSTLYAYADTRGGGPAGSVAEGDESNNRRAVEGLFVGGGGATLP